MKMYWIEMIAGLASLVLITLLIWLVLDRFKY